MEEQQSYAVTGSAMKVHRELGPGFLERTCQRALAVDLRSKGIPHRREVPVPVWYGSGCIGTFRADLECFGGLLVELKARPSVSERDIWQLAQYLTATGRPVGLLINFGAPSLQSRRVFPRRASPSGPPANPFHPGASVSSTRKPPPSC